MKNPRQLAILHPAAGELYHYILGQRFDPGAQAEIFQAKFTNPLYSYRGTGRLAGALRVFQPPQLSVQQLTMISGMGGLVTGQRVMAPLFVPVGETGN